MQYYSLPNVLWLWARSMQAQAPLNSSLAAVQLRNRVRTMLALRKILLQIHQWRLIVLGYSTLVRIVTAQPRGRNLRLTCAGTSRPSYRCFNIPFDLIPLCLLSNSIRDVIVSAYSCAPCHLILSQAAHALPIEILGRRLV